MKIGQRIVQIREKLRLRQKSFADQLGVTATSVSLWETDTNYPNIKTLLKIAALGDVSVGWLIAGEVPPSVETANEKEQRLLSGFRQLEKDQQQAIIDIVVDMVFRANSCE